MPFQCRMVPESPTAQTSPAPVPHTPKRSFVVPLETLVQAPPSQCKMVPDQPTAQTLFAPLPQTPQRGFVVPLEAVVQALPSQWTMVPAQPTAQTSLASLPQTRKRRCPWGNGFRQRQFSALQTGVETVAVKFWLVMFPPLTVTALLAGLKL